MLKVYTVTKHSLLNIAAQKKVCKLIGEENKNFVE